MDKRYQVFVSSTYADLKEERQKVMQTLMEMDCIPSGMELFPAADEEQFEFIKKIIDDCDYYLLIIGGRYGSVGADGISFTEKEYEYALERGIKVLALLHENPSSIPSGKTEADENRRKQLHDFREKAKAGRLIRYWKTTDELPGLVSLSLSKTIKTYPALGWIRASKTTQEEMLNEINELRKENEKQRQIIEQYREAEQSSIENISGLTETFEIFWNYRDVTTQPQTVKRYSLVLSWHELFEMIGALLLRFPPQNTVTDEITVRLAKRMPLGRGHYEILSRSMHLIRLKLTSLGLITVDHTHDQNGQEAIYWKLTPKGEAVILDLGLLEGAPKGVRLRHGQPALG